VKEKEDKALMDTMVPLIAPIQRLSVMVQEEDIAQGIAWEEEAVLITNANATKVLKALIVLFVLSFH